MLMDNRLLVLKVVAHIEQNLLADVTTPALVEYSGYSLNRRRLEVRLQFPG